MTASVLTDPNVAFLLLLAGVLGLIWEWHAPGMFVPGVLGALLLGAGVYGLYQDTPGWGGVALVAIAVLLLTVEMKYYTHMVSGVAGTVLLAFAATMILEGPRRVSPSVAIAVSVAFGMVTIFLGFLGMRARQSKQLMGRGSLVGKIGVSRTEIAPDHGPPGGFVFVDGEYWQARSDHRIAVGQRVAIEQMRELVLYVREA